jgi:hypothetical protein
MRDWSPGPPARRARGSPVQSARLPVRTRCRGWRDVGRDRGIVLRIDVDLADKTRQAGCRICGAVLHSARYPRKPRGGPAGLPAEHDYRHRFCSAVDGCRRRRTPPSVRFLGRKFYLRTVVVLATALRHGATPSASPACANCSGSTRARSGGGGGGGVKSSPRARGGGRCRALRVARVVERPAGVAAAALCPRQLGAARRAHAVRGADDHRVQRAALLEGRRWPEEDAP